MAAEKFIRVSVTLPVGVKLASDRHDGGDVADLLSVADGFFSSRRTRVRQESSGALELTLECPQAKRDELIEMLSALVRDLRAS